MGSFRKGAKKYNDALWWRDHRSRLMFACCVLITFFYITWQVAGPTLRGGLAEMAEALPGRATSIAPGKTAATGPRGGRVGGPERAEKDTAGDSEPGPEGFLHRVLRVLRGYSRLPR